MQDYLLLAVAGFAAGAVNAVAGGGSLITFPALLHCGLPSVVANATNTIAIWPGTVSSAWAYRRLIYGERRQALRLALPSLFGGLVGSVLLFHAGEAVFRAVVPWLILFACALLAAQDAVARLVAARQPRGIRGGACWLVAAQLLVAVYGGYFGAGIGILMLAVLGSFMPDNLQGANALKVLFSLLTNGAAAIVFLAAGVVALPEGLLMAVASLAGGFAGACFAQRLSPTVLRGVVVSYGLVVAAILFVEG
ncbi:MAG: sulfite exporter TauE/SafE family protein [Deltaproteobacteria bacterium]|nr:sulfite exporter TauE/SafE family protein [Deltaproteobacteria bacterium]